MVLGKGEFPKVPCVVRAKEFSKLACKKIAEVGGVAQLIAFSCLRDLPKQSEKK